MPLYRPIVRYPLFSGDKDELKRFGIYASAVDAQPPYGTQSNSLSGLTAGTSVGTRVSIRGGTFAPRQTPVGGKFK